MPDRPPDDMDDDIGEFASPACAMHAADDVYMGYAGNDELIAFLHELLATERAIARVASESHAAIGAGASADLLQKIAHDAGLCCATLANRLQSLGGAPASDTDTFHTDAMAIADLEARIVFLSHDQDRLLHSLRAMLPRVRDAGLQRDLTAMRERHEADLAQIGAILGRVPQT